MVRFRVNDFMGKSKRIQYTFGGNIMKVFTYSQFRQQLSSILDLARREGLVMIKRKDESFFKEDILIGIRESRGR